MPTFDPQQEKETYQRERKEVLGQDWGASTSSVPHVRRSRCARETNWEGKHYKRILEKLCRDNER
jgi:hypothetical protein